jgi:hypothetical protein
MWSYPNLPALRRDGQHMAEILEPFAFDAVYGSFSGRFGITCFDFHVDPELR